MGCSGSTAPSATPKTKTSTFFFEEYRIGALLGSGVYANVFEVKGRESGREKAVKVMQIEETTSTTDEDEDMFDAPVKIRRKKQEALKEVMLWKKIGPHENCVQLFDHFEGPKMCLMVMEKCEGCLWEKFKKVQDALVLSQLVQQMLLAVAHLHGLRIVHRDIKHGNFLVSSDGKPKLCDFGLAEMLPEQGFLDGVHGTPPYMSPEMLKCKGYDQATDMWSLGVLLYVFKYGKFPYAESTQDSNAMKLAIRQNILPPQYPKKLDPFDKLIVSLLDRSPGTRLSAVEALDHPFCTSMASGRVEKVGFYNSEYIDYGDCKVLADKKGARDIDDLSTEASSKSSKLPSTPGIHSRSSSKEGIYSRSSSKESWPGIGFV